MPGLLRLDPSLPVLWRTPHSLQVGFDPPVVLLDCLDERYLPVLAALGTGVSQDAYDAIASHEGLDPEHAASLLEVLAPVLTARLADPLPSIHITGSTGHLGSFARVMRELGYPMSTEPDEAIVISSYVMPASAYTPWLYSDIPHTPVLMSDQAIIVGPRVTPGEGPCLACVWNNRAARDPALVALATQLSIRQAWTDKSAHHALAAWYAVELLRTRRHGLTVRIDRYTREVTRHLEEPSPTCVCRSLG